MLRILAILAVTLASGGLQAQTAAQDIGQQANGSTDCRVRINPAPSAWIIQGYDPFSDSEAADTFGISFTNNGTGECRFVPLFRMEQPPFGLSRHAGAPIPYTLISLADSQDVTPRPGMPPKRPSQRDVTLAPNETKTLLFRLVASPGNDSEAGTFTQDVTVEAEDSDLSVVGGTRLVLGVNILPAARLGLAGAYTVNNGHAVVDLGELRQGPAPVPLQLRVNSTGRYDLSVSSANGGRLRLGSSDWYVPYSLAIGGQPVNLSGNDRLSGPTGSGLTRTALPLQFVINDVAGRRAGIYADVISISVTAR